MDAEVEIQENEDVDATDLQLIFAVQENPILWDSREQDYKNASKKTVVWKRVGVKVNMTGGKTCFLKFYQVSADTNCLLPYSKIYNKFPNLFRQS